MDDHLNSHPYAPSSLNIPHYVPNEKSTVELLFIAGGIMTALVGMSYAISRSWLSKNTTSTARFTWFAICGLMHCGFEGYWLSNRATLAGQNDIFAQLWKEYAHGDSRYLANDELLLTLEIMTIFIWGPLCLTSAYYILRNSPKQYIFQLIASLCHLFSCSLYFIMDLPEARHCVSSPVYFYIYFLGFNSPWILVPLLLVNQSYHYLNHALAIKHKSV
ncbi:Emopamil-binding protein [Mucor lusitanicus]|uniref:Emopamil-binding protein n=1 Tax=Mucor circinelloides f. lusitanicus TaxID=29924 RepID=A0A8H4B7U8_MUCCL|nr:Emopamil-binding protein [Mucor lusitanicus]